MATASGTIRDSVRSIPIPSAIPHSQPHEILHEMVSGVSSWLLFKKKKGDLYIVGSLDVDRYILVPSNKLKLTMQCIGYLDGSHDLRSIHDRILADHGRDADIGELLLKLKTAGLIKTAQPEHHPHNELLRHSIQLFEVKVSAIFERLRVLKALFHPYFLAFGLSLVALSLLRAASIGHFRLPHADNVGLEVLDYLLFWVGLLLVAVVHEAFHGFAAMRYGLRPTRINGALYLGFIPYIFISIPGIYTLRPRHRIIVWSAGVYANCLLGALLLFLLPHLANGTALHEAVVHLIWANLLIVMMNISPFMATDGYFVLSTLVRTPNIRTNAYLEFKKWVKREDHNFSAVLACYFVISSALIVWVFFGTATWLRAVVEQWLRYGWTTRIAMDLTPIAFMLFCLIVQAVWNRKLQAPAS